MTAEINQDFVTYKGDDVYPIFTVRDSAGVAIDISTVSNIAWYAQQTEEDAAAVTRLKSLGQITFVTNGTDGKFQVAIPATVTVLLDGYYIHKATLTDATGLVTTVTVGRMKVGLKPSWSYDASKIESIPLYQVRRLIGDVINNDQQLSDAEIRWAISERSSVYGAAADCARQIAAQYSRKPDVSSPGGITTNYGAQARKYLDLAGELDSVARARGGGITPYAGGISVEDKRFYEQDADRVRPSFNVAMQDNTLPVSQVGNEVLNNPADNPGA